MFTSMTARVSTNTYCIARTRRLSKRSVGRVAHESEAPTDTVQLVSVRFHCVFKNIAITPVSFVSKRRSWHHLKVQEPGFLVDTKHSM